jgi:hypothetical protein
MYRNFHNYSKLFMSKNYQFVQPIKLQQFSKSTNIDKKHCEKLEKIPKKSLIIEEIPNIYKTIFRTAIIDGFYLCKDLHNFVWFSCPDELRFLLLFSAPPILIFFNGLAIYDIMNIYKKCKKCIINRKIKK